MKVALPPRRVAGAAAVLAALTCGTWAACSACGKGTGAGASSASGAASAPVVSRTSAPAEAGAAAVRDVAMWTAAREGGAVEDLATLATHEGAAGLIEAAAEPELRTIALRAMGYARGWAQLPYLAQTAAGTDDEEAKLALESAVEVAARPRRAEDVEDAVELREGCEKLGALARDTARASARRIPALKALRMLPCPKQELPTDLDAR